MTDETKLACDKWLELIEKILEVYITAKKAKYTEQNNNDYRRLGRICYECSEMLAIVEKY